MAIGKFYGGVAVLVRDPPSQRYLLIRRSAEKDFASGAWECVTGRVDQGEGFEEAALREVKEELGVEAQLEFIIGTTHFYRGETIPANELIGVVYCAAIAEPEAIRLSQEHQDFQWVRASDVHKVVGEPTPTSHWLERVVARAEAILERSPDELLSMYRSVGFELG